MAKDNKAKKAVRITFYSILGTLGVGAASAIIFGILVFPYLFLIIGWPEATYDAGIGYWLFTILGLAIQGLLVLIGISFGLNSLLNWAWDTPDSKEVE